MIKRILINIILLSFTSVNAINCLASTPVEPEDKSAFSEFYIGVGLSGTQFFKDTPSWNPITYSLNPSQDVIGGSFDGLESGIHFSFVTNLTKSSELMLPFSFEYNWLSSGEILYPTPVTEWLMQHSIDVQKIGTGLQWQFYTFPFKDVKAYMETDIKMIFINNQKISKTAYETNSDGSKSSTVTSFVPKETAIRFGAEYKLGFRGQLTKNFFINSFLGIELMNILGRDNNRGELLTPFGSLTQNPKRFESKEQYVPNLDFVLMIEYKL